MLLTISVAKLANHFSIFSSAQEPTDAWGDTTTEEVVRECLRLGIFEPKPFSDCSGHGGQFNAAPYCHASRIAYLVKNEARDPIEIDVGAPCLGYYDVTLVDGYHRLAAAIVGGKSQIEVNVAGELSYARHLFVRKNKRYAHI
jgi:hypothetical protein